MKFKVGDKVVPVGKSTGDTLDHSNVWKRCLENNQPFMYVTEITSDGIHTCDNFLSIKDGDFFLESDLVLLDKDELKTGDLVIVEDEVNPRIFLFAANDLFYCVACDDEREFIAGYDFFRVRGWKTFKKVPPKPISV